MGLGELVAKRVVMVAGKGGVGRTTMVAAIAVQAAKLGKRVLVTEIGEDNADYSALARSFGHERLAREPRQLAPGIAGCQLVSRVGQELFLTSVLRTGVLARAALASEALTRFLSAAPSFREMGVFYHLLTLLNAKRFDGSPEHELILIDMPATGHALALTSLPDMLLRLVSRGPIYDALKQGQAYLNDPRLAAAHVVTLPETLPVSEALELIEGLGKTNVALGGVILNRMPVVAFTDAEREALTPIVEQHLLFGSDLFGRHVGATRALSRIASAVACPILPIAECDSTAPDFLNAIGYQLAEPQSAPTGHQSFTRRGRMAVPVEVRPGGPEMAKSVSSIAGLVARQRVIVCCGAGGVGKTTTAASLALAAARSGRRVLVLTIDPSKRLAETLGVTRNPAAPVPLPEDRMKAAGIAPPGSLHAWMLDPKRVADDSVRRLVKSPEEAERIFSNRVYQQVTQLVAGLHEYTAMAALYRFITEGPYDLVVLDTPPSRNALDFLEAPSHLTRFLDGAIFRLFIPKDGGLLERAASSVIARVMSATFGSDLASELTTFMKVFGDIFSALSTDLTVMRELLTRPEVAFLLVTSPAPAALTEAHFFQDKIRDLGLPFRGFILNKSRARDEGMSFPDDALLSPGAGDVERSALAKLQALARLEQLEVVRDRGLLADLKLRGGNDAIIMAIPTLPLGADEMGTLVTVADVLTSERRRVAR
jgi:anion-transporting  ArsA/GET3 family ATPase